MPPPKAAASPKNSSSERSSRGAPPKAASTMAPAEAALHRGWASHPHPGRKRAAAYSPPRAAPAPSRSREKGPPASLAVASRSR